MLLKPASRTQGYSVILHSPILNGSRSLVLFSETLTLVDEYPNPRCIDLCGCIWSIGGCPILAREFAQLAPIR